MNGSSPRDRNASKHRSWLFARIAPVALAVLVALPTAASARVFWSVNVGPAYPAYRVYRPYPAYSAWAVYPPPYPVYSYSAYPGYAVERVYTHRYAYRHYATSVSATAVAAPPPPLPEYDQPPAPGDGYIWTPGYWDSATAGYYWVPGTWVLAPYPGALWTPAYWGWGDGYYAFHPGYWGLHVGYYGGIDYGFGYFGVGYLGGYWHDGVFVYNRAVNNLGGVRVAQSYNFGLVNYLGRLGTRTSYNGGSHGIQSRPTTAEAAVAGERHLPALAEQQRQAQWASHDRAMFAAYNHGTPPIAATSQAGVFSGTGVVAARNPLLQDRTGQVSIGKPRQESAAASPERTNGRSVDERTVTGVRDADHERGQFGPAMYPRGFPEDRGYAQTPQQDRQFGRNYAERAMGPSQAPRGDSAGRERNNPHW